MNWLQKLLLKGVDLREVFPSFSERAGKSSGSELPFTTSLYDRYGLKYDALAKKDYIFEFRNWVFACVNARAESIGNIKLKLIDNKSGEEIDDHEIIDLLEQPNQFQTGFEFLYDTQCYKDLDGNAFWYIIREGKNGTGKPLQLFNLKSDKVKLIIDENNPLAVEAYVYTQPDGTRIRFEPYEIIHMKLSNPNQPSPFPHRGMGIVQAAAYAIDTDNETRKWNLAFFRNAARPDVVLYNQGDASLRPEEVKRYQAEWEERHQGSEHAFKTSVLSGGMKVEPITPTHTEMDFYNQRLLGRDEILSMFKVPKTVIGIADDVNRANADAAIYVYNLYTVMPIMRRMVATLNTFLVPMFDNSGRYELDFFSPISEDREQLLDEYQMAVNTWLTVNEIRARESLEPVEGGDSLFISGMDVSLGSDDTDDNNDGQPKKYFREIKVPRPKSHKKKKWTEKKAASADERSFASKAVDEFLKQIVGKREKFTTLPTDKKASYIESWKAKMEDTGEIRKSLQQFFIDQEEEVQSNLRDELKGLKPKEFKYKAVADMLFDMEDATKLAVNIALPNLKKWIATAGADAAKLVGGEFNPSTAIIESWTTDRAKFFAKTVNETTQEALKNTLSQGLANKETISELSSRVATVYGQAKAYRTDMIARTETSAASNFAAQQSYLQAGVERQQWVVVSPEDEDCLENDGEIVDIGDSFPSGDDAPPVHPNCQCTTIPVFDDSADDEEDSSDN